jgi:hypothetical protein
LRWQESGGPLVTPREEKAFGSRLIERNSAAKFGGRVEIIYDPAVSSAKYACI